MINLGLTKWKRHLNLFWFQTNQDGSGYPVIAANTYDTPGVSEEQQEKFRLSIANWCLANEGLRKSIQSLQQPPPMSLCLSSESLASICSGLQALDSGVADISEEIDNNTTDYQIIKMDERSISSHVFTIPEYMNLRINFFTKFSLVFFSYKVDVFYWD